MIRWIERILKTWGNTTQPEVVLFAHVPIHKPVGLHSHAAKVPESMVGVQSPVGMCSHRERLLAMDLAHLKVCSADRCRKLQAIGIRTAGDLVVCRVRKLCQRHRLSRRAEASLLRVKAAIRLAADVQGMTPRDALLLIAIHRRNTATLAREHAATLHRDLERFSMSTRGGRMVGQRGVPSLRRIKTWIASCRTTAIPTMQAA